MLAAHPTTLKSYFCDMALPSSIPGFDGRVGVGSREGGQQEITSMNAPNKLKTYQLYIDGQWVAPQNGEVFPTYNPYAQEPWALVSQAGEADVRAAVAAARRAFDSTWRHTNGLQRGKLLLRLSELLEENAERMGQLETTDNGKVIRETHSQMFFA